MKRKTEQKPETKTEDTKEPEIDIQEITWDGTCDVSGGSCAGCNSCSGCSQTGCGSACSAPINRMI